MFSLAIKLQMRSDNPCRGVERNQENKRTRYLSADEISRLKVALAAHEDQQAANIVRLLLLTGARLNEVQSATWEQFDIEDGVWTKPGSTTKQKTEHRVPLSAPARQLLAELHADNHAGLDDASYVFPGRVGGHRKTIRKVWEDLCESTGLNGVRVHDLRHSYASLLASAGLSLPTIGALLGHSQPSTTARYAHLADSPPSGDRDRRGDHRRQAKRESGVDQGAAGDGKRAVIISSGEVVLPRGGEISLSPSAARPSRWVMTRPTYHF